MRNLVLCLLVSIQLVAQGQWSAPVNLSVVGLSSINDVEAATNGCGFGIGAWSDGTTEGVKAALFSNGKWSSPTNIVDNFASTLGLGLSPCCNKGALVWLGLLGADLGVQASYFDGTNWSSPEILATSPLAIDVKPQVSVDDKGNAVAVWARNDGVEFVIEASIFRNGFWSIPMLVSEPGTNERFPRVGTDFCGNAIAVWAGDNASVIRASRFNGTNWSDPIDLSSIGINNLPSVSVNPKGKAVAVWINGNSPFVIQASVFDGKNWSPIPGENISVSGTVTGGSVQLQPEVSMDPCGNAVATWIRSDGANNRVQTAVFKPQTGWSDPFTISPVGINIFFDDIGTDYFQNAIGLWSTSAGGFVQASRFNGTSWSKPVNITDGSMGIGASRISVFPGGNALAIWPTGTGATEVVQASMFTIATPLFEVKGCKVPNQFLGQTDTVKCLTWCPSIACCVTGYQVIRNRQVIAFVPSNCPLCFKDHNRNNCVDQYEIRAISSGCVPVGSVFICL